MVCIMVNVLPCFCTYEKKTTFSGPVSLADSGTGINHLIKLRMIMSPFFTTEPEISRNNAAVTLL